MSSRITEIILTLYWILGFANTQLRTYEFEIPMDHMLVQRIEKLALNNKTCTSGKDKYYEFTITMDKSLDSCNAEGLLANNNITYTRTSTNRLSIGPIASKYVFEPEPAESSDRSKNIVLPTAVVGGLLGSGAVGYVGFQYIKSLVQSGVYRFPAV